MFNEPLHCALTKQALVLKMSPNLTQLLKQQSAPEDDSWQPVFFRLSEESDAVALEKLLSNNPNIVVRDQIMLQLKDLVKLENPQKTLSHEEYEILIQEKLQGNSTDTYGVWVYYPWKGEIVHLLDEEEFIRVRTIRNAYKITFEEQALLGTKKIGVIGLSVGQSVALAIAMERIAGELRLADFDHIELSNLNRLRSPNSALGQNKSTNVYNEIKSLDPYITVAIYPEGITQSDIEDSLLRNGKLDAVVEECDTIEIKILVRSICKKHGIPVISETSDLFLLDVERYDVEPDYEIFHSLLGKYEEIELQDPSKRFNFISKILDINKLSSRGQESLTEIQKSITTWPQLATDVIAGGAITAQILKQILLGSPIKSGRGRLDIMDHYEKQFQLFRKDNSIIHSNSQ